MHRIALVSALITVASCTTVPTSTPSAGGNWTSREVLAAFESAGLEVRDAHEMTRSELYTGVPMEALSGAVVFSVSPSYTPDPAAGLPDSCLVRVYTESGGKIGPMLSGAYIRHRFDPRMPPSAEDAGSLLWYEWVVERDNVLLHIQTCLSADRAAKYVDALDGISRSPNSVPSSARKAADPCWFEYVTAPMVPECAEQLAKFSAEVPQLNDLAVPIDHVSTGPGLARERFGMNTDVEGGVEFVLLDVWGRHTLDTYNPTNPAAPGTPPPSFQMLSAVFVEPGGEIRIRHTEALTGPRKTRVFEIDRTSITWD